MAESGSFLFSKPKAISHLGAAGILKPTQYELFTVLGDNFYSN